MGLRWWLYKNYSPEYMRRIEFIDPVKHNKWSERKKLCKKLLCWFICIGLIAAALFFAIHYLYCQSKPSSNDVAANTTSTEPSESNVTSITPSSQGVISSAFSLEPESNVTSTTPSSQGLSSSTLMTPSLETVPSKSNVTSTTPSSQGQFSSALVETVPSESNLTTPSSESQISNPSKMSSLDAPDNQTQISDCSGDGLFHCNRKEETGIRAECFSMSHVCDDVDDCSNGADEGDCVRLSPSLQSFQLSKLGSIAEGYVVVQVKGVWHVYCTSWSEFDGYASVICKHLNYKGVSEVRMIKYEDFASLVLDRTNEIDAYANSRADGVNLVDSVKRCESIGYIRCE